MRDRVTFKSVFIAVFIGTAAIVVAFLVNAQRPKVEVAQPSADLVKASGKCAECHRRETSAIVHQYEGSKHAAKGVTCLDCHRPAADQHGIEHKGFTIEARPYKDGGQYQLAGLVWKEVDGVRKEHRFIRADRFSGAEEAATIALMKGRQMIDERGERLFD